MPLPQATWEGRPEHTAHRDMDVVLGQPAEEPGPCDRSRSLSCSDEHRLVQMPGDAALSAIQPGGSGLARPVGVGRPERQPLPFEQFRMSLSQRIPVVGLEGLHLADVTQSKAGSSGAKPVFAITDQPVRGIEHPDPVRDGALPEHRRLAESADIRVVLRTESRVVLQSKNR